MSDGARTQADAPPGPPPAAPAPPAAGTGAVPPRQAGGPMPSGGRGAAPVAGGSMASVPAPVSADPAPEAAPGIDHESSPGSMEPPPAAAEPTAPPATEGAGMGYDHDNEQVQLSEDLVIAPGEVLRIGPSTTLTASSGVAVRVEGMLIVEGSEGAPVRFVGTGMPRSWHGIVVEAGGGVTMTHVEIGGATYGLHAKPGSQFTVERADIGTSFKAAVLQSDGTIDSTRFHASGDPGFSPVSEVSIDDVNGTLTIIEASPTISNSRFDSGTATVDMVRVGGESSPVFDHVYITDAHCGIHAFGAVNSQFTVSNSVFEGLAYGMMIYTTAPIVRDSVFAMNATDVGFCFGATEANRPTLTNNYYSSGAVVADPSCFGIGAVDANPATSAHATAGPVGL